jgi:VanZ family protein
MIGSRWIQAIAWAALILTATSLPSTPAGPAVPGIDKVVHFALYAVLGGLTMRAAESTSVRSVITWTLAIALFAAVDEWHQFFIPNRSADVIDWVADVAGGAAGTGSLAALKLRRMQRT